MNRLALRMLTKGALLNGGSGFPTMAGGLVHDSKQTNFTDLESDARGPQIVIRTDSDQTDRLGQGPRATDRDLLRRIELRIEFAIWASRSVGGVAVNPWPVSDAPLEAMLDFFEYQIEAALYGSHPWGILWRDLFAIESRVSTPFMLDSEQGRVKLAAREIVLSVQAHPDCKPKHGFIDDPAPTPMLPPALVAVFARIDRDATGDFKAYAAGIKAQLESGVIPVGYQYPQLKTVAFTVPEASTPAGRQPRIDIEGFLLQNGQ